MHYINLKVVVACFCMIQLFSNVGAQADTDRSLSSTDQLVTVSLVPDGTLVGDQPSSLFSSVGSDESSIQDVKLPIAIACQRWARHTNINFTFVEDAGVPLGSRGLNQKDSRFGDIRIAAIPMPLDVRGVAFSRENIIAGTWSGDIILNSEYPFNDQTLLEVVIHELGHSLGFEHVEGVPSVLNTPNALVELTEYDKALVQDRFGVRNLDTYDAGESNGNIDGASDLKTHSSDLGELPALAFGDLPDANDVDYYEFRPEPELGGLVTFQLRINGNSLVSANLTLVDENNDFMARVSSAGLAEGIGQLSIPVDQLPDKTYVRVQSEEGEFATGSYAVVAFYESRLDIEPGLLESASSWNNSYLDQNDARELFREGSADFHFHDDLHTNDTLLTATLLDPVGEVNDLEIYRVDASISDNVDRDFYLFDVAGGDAGLPTTIRVHSRDEGMLIPSVDLMNAQGESIDHEIVANGNGQLLIKVSALAEGSYAIAVSHGAVSTQKFKTGNYTLEIRFDQYLPSLTQFAGGQFGRNQYEYHAIRIARSQMFHFGLYAISGKHEPETVVYATVFDEQGNQVYQVATRPGEFRSSQSILLPPGSYVVRVEVASRRLAKATLYPMVYRFEGIPDTDSEGPGLIDSTESPFPMCEDHPDMYCYPEAETDNPFIWVDGLPPDLVAPAAPPAPYKNIDRLYWPLGVLS